VFIHSQQKPFISVIAPPLFSLLLLLFSVLRIVLGSLVVEKLWEGGAVGLKVVPLPLKK